MSELKILTLNVNSIAGTTRRHLLDQFLKENNPDILLLTETHLNHHHKVSFTDYKIIRADRKDKKEGGCAILIKEKFDYKILNINNLNSLEIASIILTSTNDINKVYIAAVYNYKGSIDYSNDLNKIMAFKGNNTMILGGDFNSRHIDFGDSQCNKSGKSLQKWLRDEGIVHNISQIPTFRPTRGASYLDFFLISNELNINYNSQHPYFLPTLDCESDHKAVEVIISNQDIKRSIPRTIYNFAKADIPKFHEIINNEATKINLPQNRNLKNDEITAAVEEVGKILGNAMEIGVPKITLKERGMIPLHDNILKLIQEKKKIRRRYNRTGNPLFKAQARDITKIIDEQIIAHTKQHSEDVFAKIKMDNNTFRQLKNLSGVNRNYDITHIEHNNVIHDKPEEIVNILANQFESVHKQNHNMGFADHNALVENLIPTIINLPPLIQFNEDTRSLGTSANNNEENYKQLTNVKELGFILKSRNNKKSAGNDRLAMFLIKKIPISLKKILFIIFNNMYNKAFIPDFWKQAKVGPILKPSKNPMNPTSYRPISLINNLSKVYEVFLNWKMNTHIRNNNVLKDNQFGFRNQLSVSHALAVFSTDVAINLNNKRGSLAVGIDTEKAFDTTWQSGIIYKMKQLFGFPDHLCKIINNYLKNRTFYVQQNEVKSTIRGIADGVPQGSILGPTLFNLFIADMPTPNEDIKTLGYADDLLIYSSHARLSLAEARINKYLENYKYYTDKWKIKSNAAKCEVIKIVNSTCYKNAKKFKAKILLGNNQIENVTKMKYLGLIITNNFSFKDHVKAIINKCKGALVLYNRILKKTM